MSNVRSLGMLPDPRTTFGGFSVSGFLFGLGDGPFLLDAAAQDGEFDLVQGPRMLGAPVGAGSGFP